MDAANIGRYYESTEEASDGEASTGSVYRADGKTFLHGKAPALGQVDLNTVTGIELATFSGAPTEWGMQMPSPERVWEFAAESEQARDSWMQVVRTLIVKRNTIQHAGWMYKQGTSLVAVRAVGG